MLACLSARNLFSRKRTVAAQVLRPLGRMFAICGKNPHDFEMCAERSELLALSKWRVPNEVRIRHRCDGLPWALLGEFLQRPGAARQKKFAFTENLSTFASTFFDGSLVAAQSPDFAKGGRSSGGALLYVYSPR